MSAYGIIPGGLIWTACRSSGSGLQMKTADLSSLRDQILELARSMPIGERVRDVSVIASDDGFGGEFLRVQFEMDDLDSIEPEDVEPLIDSIEDKVAQKDERFPSVFFSEAA